MSEYGKQSNYIEKIKIIKADSRKWQYKTNLWQNVLRKKKKKYK